MDLRPSSDALFKISVPFFAQIEIPSYSLQILMGRFQSDEKTASSFCFFRDRGLGLVAHTPLLK